MGDEFIAHFGSASRPRFQDVERSLTSTGRYLVERSSENEIALRFSSKARRSDWPEDFTLTIHERSLLLTIHGATKQERAEIVRDVKSALRQFGNSIKLDNV